MKPLNLPKESQETLLNGASMFIEPIYHSYLISDEEMIETHSPYQIGDEVRFSTLDENYDSYQELYTFIFDEKVSNVILWHNDNKVTYIKEKSNKSFDWLEDRTFNISMDKFKVKVKNALKVLKNTYRVEIKTKMYSTGEYSSSIYGIGGASSAKYISEYEIKSTLDAFKAALHMARDINSRFKAIIKDVKVTTLDNISDNEMQKILGIDFHIPIVYCSDDDYTSNQAEKACAKLYSYFKDWYNKQYDNYDKNPYVFLYEIERTNK